QSLLLSSLVFASARASSRVSFSLHPRAVYTEQSFSQRAKRPSRCFIVTRLELGPVHPNSPFPVSTNKQTPPTTSIMTDAELDRDWQPNGRRPQSTIARSFSQELMDIFRIENSLTDLDQQVDTRRQNVGKTNQELADIEARIREMEERLRRSQHSRPGIQTIAPQSSSSSSQNRVDALPPPPKDDGKSRSRPGTARAAQQAPSSGNMPPTPGASEGEYYVVTRADLDDAPR
ncbi:Uncharacterized protein TPAR_08045, partial [Tolypocladium paradoxum]